MDEHLPTSMEEVESLVHQLYRPAAPGEVVRVQETLQRLQRSSEGWQLAQRLLENQDEQVRFFGALTFTVKLNTDAKSLSEDDAANLLQTLIGFLINSLTGSEGGLVVRKLCSTLVAYFLQFPTQWTQCLRHLTYCLFKNAAHRYQNVIGEIPDMAIMLQDMPTQKSVALLWFSGGLVEEVGKMDSNSMKQHKFHQQILPNVDDAVPLISKFIGDNSAEIKIRHEALKCFQSWVSYSHRAFIDDHVVLDPLRALTQPTIMCTVEEDLYETAVEIVTEILSNYSKFLLKEDFDLLFSLINSPWAQEKYEQLLNGDYDFDSLQFGMLLVAFGDANAQELTTGIGNGSQYEQLLSVLCGLLGADGYAVHEDKIFVPAMEFWTTYVENVLDCSYGDDNGKEKWLPVAQNFIFQALERCVRKIQFPPAHVFNSWDSVDRTSFKDARRDFSDLIQQFYIITGIRILDFFVQFADHAIEKQNWFELEVAWFVIRWLCESIAEDSHRDQYLNRVFNRSVLELVANTSIELPTRVRRTFLEVVKAYSDYFIANTENLPAVLNVVFGATTKPALASLASHSISKLCSECRHILLPELDAFLQQYARITTSSSVDAVVKEGVIQGISALIQAIPDERAKLGPLSQLLDCIERDVEHCVQLAALEPVNLPRNNAIDGIYPIDGAGAAIGLVAMKCLEGMAKGSQAPNETPVDLEKPEGDVAPQFWVQGEGAIIQHRVVSYIHRVFDALGHHGEIVEATCQVLRRGFQESEPGPFVLPTETAAQILLKANSRTPRLGFVMRTACNLILAERKDGNIDNVVDTVFSWVLGILQQLGDPGNDPEIAQDGIDFTTRLLSKHIKVFLNHQPSTTLEELLMFTLKALAGTDPLPKAAACEFWATFTALSGLEPPVQSSLTSIFEHFGPLLSQALVYNIGGHASRSELDKLSDPIRKLVVRHTEAKSWLEAALHADNFPSTNVNEDEKRAFLMKIINQRGSKLTNQIVREFWLACRGSNFAYAS